MAQHCGGQFEAGGEHGSVTGAEPVDEVVQGQFRVAAEAHAAPPPSGGKGVVNINTAASEQLQLLPEAPYLLAPGSRGALLVGREVERSETSDDHECTRDAKRRLT